MKEYYKGLDLGMKWTYATMIDEEKHVIKEGKIPCTEQTVEMFFIGIPKDCLNVVIEACGIWHGLYDYLVMRCKVVKVANPLQMKLDRSVMNQEINDCAIVLAIADSEDLAGTRTEVMSAVNAFLYY